MDLIYGNLYYLDIGIVPGITDEDGSTILMYSHDMQPESKHFGSEILYQFEDPINNYIETVPEGMIEDVVFSEKSDYNPN